MASAHAQNAQGDSPSQAQPSEFELRRAGLVGEIGESLEQVLAQINALNRSLEAIIEIGNEFASVEALWSQFEGVMGRNDEEQQTDGDANGEEEQTQMATEEGGNDEQQTKS